MRHAARLVLFDVDGTLVRGGRHLRSWFAEALVEVFGHAGDLDGYCFAGKIDPQIVLELLSGAGVPETAIAAGLPRMKRLYLERLARELGPNDVQLLPQVAEVLEELQARPDVILGLLTGNWEAGARSKLACVDLNRFFSFGAFGDGRRSRHELPPVALERARRATGRRFSSAETLIVGDSLLDVECARAHGMACVAVATGPTPRSALESSGANWVVADFGELRRAHPTFRS